MSFTYWRIDHTPYIDNKWVTASTTQITDILAPRVTVNLGADRDSFTFSLVGVFDRYQRFFRNNDRIVIYRALNSTTINTTTDVLINGTLKNNPINETGKDNTLELSGFNYSETVLGAIVFVDIVNKTIPEAFIQTLNNLNEKNPNFGVTWNYATNATVKSDGSPFPTVSERFFYKPAAKVFEKYSQPAYTQDGNYYWYVDVNNQFVFNKGTQNTSSTFNVTTDECTSLKISKDTKGVKNYYILRGGLDPDKKQIQERFVAWSSVAKHGQQYQFVVSEKNKAENLVFLDIVQTFGTSIPAGTTYPNLTSDYTTRWAYETRTGISGSTEVVSGITCTHGVAVTITGATESQRKERYREILRQHIKNLLYKEGQNLSQDTENGKLQLEIEFRAGTKNWKLSEKVSCFVPDISLSPIELRVTEINYAEDFDFFVLKEDRGTL